MKEPFTLLFLWIKYDKVSFVAYADENTDSRGFTVPVCDWKHSINLRRQMTTNIGHLTAAQTSDREGRACLLRGGHITQTQLTRAGLTRMHVSPFSV